MYIGNTINPFLLQIFSSYTKFKILFKIFPSTPESDDTLEAVEVINQDLLGKKPMFSY